MAKSIEMKLECLKGKYFKALPGSALPEYPPGVTYGHVDTEGSSLEKLYRQSRVYLLNKQGETIDSINFAYLCKRHQAIIMLAVQEQYEQVQADRAKKKSAEANQTLAYDIESGGLSFDGAALENGSTWYASNERYDAIARSINQAQAVMEPNPFLAILDESAPGVGSFAPGVDVAVEDATPSRPRRGHTIAPRRSQADVVFEPSLEYVQRHMNTDAHLEASSRFYSGDIFFIGGWRCAPSSIWSARELESLYEQLGARDRRLGRLPVVEAETSTPTLEYVVSNMAMSVVNGIATFTYNGRPFNTASFICSPGTRWSEELFEMLRTEVSAVHDIAFMPTVDYLYSNYTLPSPGRVHYRGRSFSFEGTNLLQGALIAYDQYFALVDRINAYWLQRRGSVVAAAGSGPTVDSDDDLPF